MLARSEQVAAYLDSYVTISQPKPQKVKTAKALNAKPLEP